jgi:hypothetical protein
MQHWSDNVAPEQQYMIVELITNLAADGLVLCFLHSYPHLQVANKDAIESARPSTVCGNDALRDGDVSALFNQLHQYLSYSPGATGQVFQILENAPVRQLIVSWPAGQLASSSASEFAKLASNADLGAASGRGLGSSIFGHTSCIRRFKSLGVVNVGDGTGLKKVESIFVPHGQSHGCPSPSRAS